jgi:hypothetical protein
LPKVERERERERERWGNMIKKGDDGVDDGASGKP